MPRSSLTHLIPALAVIAIASTALANRALTAKEDRQNRSAIDLISNDPLALWTNPAPGALAMFGISAGFAIRGRRRSTH